MSDTERNAGLLATPGVVSLLLVIALGIGSFSILLPLSPEWAIRGGASEAAAGSVTAVLMAFTILTQLYVNRALERFGWGTVLATGLLALGAPALLQAISFDLATLLLSSAIRGVGFGILTVSGATAIALLAPPERRGAAVGLYGLAVASPQLVLISSAPILELHLGILTVTMIATLPVFGLFWTRPLGRLLDGHTEANNKPVDANSAQGRSVFFLIAPVLLSLFIVTSSGGAIMTFAGQITAEAVSATIALLCLTGLATPTRWVFGTLSDRYPVKYLIMTLAAVCCLGMAALSASVLISDQLWGLVWLYLGSSLLGVSYGGMQTATLVCAYRLAGNSQIARVAVLWNVTFDLGTGVGAMFTGVIATTIGFGVAFGILSAAAAVSLLLILTRLQVVNNNASSR